ncbi:MAG: hypothetical protein SNJ33_04065 [Rikenellaceae bacterium]
MKNLIDRMMGAVKHFTPFDFAIFKLAIFSAGILVGAYFIHFWAKNISVVWGVALAAGVLTLIKVIRYAMK